jgi:hypothetical protein
MQTVSLLDGRWSSVLARVSAVVDLDATAREFKALQRVGKIRHGSEILRLALMYGPGQSSLRTTAAQAPDAGLPDLSDKAVEGRLRQAGDWLAHVLQRLLADRQGTCEASEAGALNLALVDGSVICGPASTGSDWRLHARFDPARGCFGDLALTSGQVGERVNRTRIEPGQTVIQDRGYARVRDFAAVLAAKSDFITRIGWRSLRLLNGEGQVIDVLTLLPADHQLCEHIVFVRGMDHPLRLVIQPVPPEKAAQQRQRVGRKASKAGHKIDPRTTVAAGYMMLVTSLSADRQSAADIVSLYRNRWQVELGFKRLKTIGGIDKLPTSDPRLARTWLLAHLIAAVLTEEIASDLAGFSPSAGCSGWPSDLALAGLDQRTTNPLTGHPTAVGPPNTGTLETLPTTNLRTTKTAKKPSRCTQDELSFAPMGMIPWPYFRLP